MLMYGRELGGLVSIVQQCQRSLPPPPTLPFDCANYLDWINTLLPEGVFLEVIPTPCEPYYFSKVMLTIQREGDGEREEDREEREARLNGSSPYSSSYYINYCATEQLFGVEHVEPKLTNCS
jgi:hypothetical protein